jgi:hypothetical protein
LGKFELTDIHLIAWIANDWNEFFAATVMDRCAPNDGFLRDPLHLPQKPHHGPRRDQGQLVKIEDCVRRLHPGVAGAQIADAADEQHFYLLCALALLKGCNDLFGRRFFDHCPADLDYILAACALAPGGDAKAIALDCIRSLDGQWAVGRNIRWGLGSGWLPA